MHEGHDGINHRALRANVPFVPSLHKWWSRAQCLVEQRNLLVVIELAGPLERNPRRQVPAHAGDQNFACTGPAIATKQQRIVPRAIVIRF
jgi:hypothetical protein